jgi:hypothetical protein
VFADDDGWLVAIHRGTCDKRCGAGLKPVCPFSFYLV